MFHEERKNLSGLLAKIFEDAYSKEALERYLTILFENLSLKHSDEDGHMPFVVFHKLMHLPLLISRHLYRVISNGTSQLSLSAFTSGLVSLYLGNFDQRLSIVFSLCDCDQDGEIIKEDIILFLKHFHCLFNTNQSLPFTLIEDTVSLVFNCNKSLTLSQLRQESLVNSDLTMLLLVYFAYANPFKVQSVKLFEKKEIKKLKSLSSFSHSEKEEHELMADSSEELFSYINGAFNENLKFTSTFTSTSDDSIEILEQFESDVKQIIKDYDCYQKVETKLMRSFENTRDSSSYMDIPIKHTTSNFDKLNLAISDIEESKEPMKINFTPTLTSNTLLIPGCSIHSCRDKMIPTSNMFLLNIEGQMEVQGKLIEVVASLVNKDLVISSKKGIIEVFSMSNYQIAFEVKSKVHIISNVHLDQSVVLLPKYSVFLSAKRIYVNDKSALEHFVTKAQAALNQRKINEHYSFEGEIYRGENSYILKGKSLSTGQLVAIKIVSKRMMNTSIIEMIETECEVYRLLLKYNNKNVIKVHDLFETTNYYYLVSEYLPNGNLSTYLEGTVFTDKEPFDCLINQVVHGLKFLHGFGIIHRDLKSDNILIANDGYRTLFKLTDFGLSKIAGLSEKAHDPCGTLCYTAPEILSQIPYTSPVDIWSLGILSFYAWYRQFPFSDMHSNLIAITDKIRKGVVVFPKAHSRISPECDSEIQLFISSCLQLSPENRPLFNK